MHTFIDIKLDMLTDSYSSDMVENERLFDENIFFKTLLYLFLLIFIATM